MKQFHTGTYDFSLCIMVQQHKSVWHEGEIKHCYVAASNICVIIDTCGLNTEHKNRPFGVPQQIMKILIKILLCDSWETFYKIFPNIVRKWKDSMLERQSLKIHRILSTSIKVSTATISACTAKSLVVRQLQCVTSNSFAGYDELVAVEDSINVGNVLYIV